MRKEVTRRLIATVLTAMMIMATPTCIFADEQSTVGNGNSIYSVLKLTGDRMPEEQIVNANQLNTIESLAELSLSVSGEFMTESGNGEINGIGLGRFLTLCGAELKPDTTIAFYEKNTVDPVKKITCGSADELNDYVIETDLASGQAITLYAKAFAPVKNLVEIRICSTDACEDPYYCQHLREPLNNMQDTKFTVRMVDVNKYSTADDTAEAFKVISCTMAEIEQLIRENPEHTTGNYFGISGNEASKNTLGLGGFYDYFEGLSMPWFLSEKAGLKDGSGFAVFYGRDNDRYGTVKDLHYFFPENGDYSNYYLELNKTESVSGVEPVLCVSKNGYPLLPEHNHEMEGNVDYNTMHNNAAELGYVEKEFGIVKNVNGPFVAGLPNLDGSYGGYRNETSGDCIRIDLYVDRGQYSVDTMFSDVSEDSWYAPAVHELAARGIVKGVGNEAFAPLKTVTRAEFVQILAVASGDDITKIEKSGTFTDVKDGDWFAAAVEWAYSNGIVYGVSSSSFAPNDLISRQDMAVMIARFAEKYKIDINNAADTGAFADKNEIASYAVEAVQQMKNAGVISGKPGGIFAPADTATRAEASKMMCHVINRARVD